MQAKKVKKVKNPPFGPRVVKTNAFYGLLEALPPLSESQRTRIFAFYFQFFPDPTALRPLPPASPVLPSLRFLM